MNGLLLAPKTEEKAAKYRHAKNGMSGSPFLRKFRGLMWEKIPSGLTCLTVSAARPREQGRGRTVNRTKFELAPLDR
jgi:hypothetical protein